MKLLPALLMTGLLCSMPALADELSMPSDTPSDAADINKPSKSMTKASVEAQYGSPESRHGPSGEPPIYYWEYPYFTVYFEGDHVIHSVAKYKNRKAMQEEYRDQ
ncbi:hypothetical protein [Agaribacterium sp. ZY112]|uniref:hypothetical protein n=1 Tax=Agaribacterium sp. ZY112 TaxID=3233574 RepID=UPI003523FA10